MTSPLREDFALTGEVVEEMRALLHDSSYIDEVLDEVKDLLVRKGQDYSGDSHSWANFETSAQLSGLDVEAIFIVPMAEKWGRLAGQLLKAKPLTPPVRGWKGDLRNWVNRVRGRKAPNYESLEDTWLDLGAYMILLVGYLRWRRGHIAGNKN